jgi:hypothetical protein
VVDAAYTFSLYQFSGQPRRFVIQPGVQLLATGEQCEPGFVTRL